MNISGTSALPGLSDPTGLKDFRRELEESRQSAAARPQIEAALESLPAQAGAGRAGSDNVMSGNFYNSNYSQSRYTMARLEDFNTERAFKDKFDGIVTSMAANIGVMVAQGAQRNADTANTAKYIYGLRSERAVSSAVNEEVRHESKQNMRQIREDIDEAVEAAEQAATGQTGSGQAPVSATAQSPAAAQDPAPVQPAGQPAPLPEAAVVETAGPADLAAAVGSASASVDLVV